MAVNNKTQLATTGSLTVEQLRAAMPKRQQRNITQPLVDELNQMADENYREFFRENLLGYTSVLKDPNTTLPGYIAAIKYVCYKAMGDTNETAWKKAHPDRYQRCIDEQRPPEYIRSIVSAYNKGRMVQQLLTQSMAPIWLLNQDRVQQAINVQAQLMMTADSEKVRTDAANSLLTHLKQPESTKVQMDVQVKDDDSLVALRKAMIDLAAEQRQALRAGVTTVTDLGKSRLIEGEVERVDE